MRANRPASLHFSAFEMLFRAEKVFNSYLWKTLLKTWVNGSQTFEIHGLLALCTHFVQTCYVLQSPMINIITAIIAIAIKENGFDPPFI